MLVILDNGHGGLIKGRPQTSQRRSQEFPDGKQLFEGELNRAIINGIIQELTFMQIPYVHICPELEDVLIGERIRRANSHNERNALLVSVHSNTNEGRAGDGCEFLIHPNSRLGPSIATIFAEEYQSAFPSSRLRRGDGGTPYKLRGDLGLLRRTSMSAIVTENFFFNNVRETREILLTRDGRWNIIDYHVAAIARVMVEVFGEPLPFNN